MLSEVNIRKVWAIFEQRRNLEINERWFPRSHHGSWWRFRSSYTRARTEFLNPTNGSWWIVQLQPTWEHESSSWIPPTEVGGLFRSRLRRETRWRMRIPPTAVGGLFRSGLRSLRRCT